MISRVFVEMYVKDIPLHISFFRDTLGFLLLRNEDGFAELSLGTSTFLLNAKAADFSGHFFHGKINSNTNGVGIEIGIIVDDIYATYDAVSKSAFSKHLSDVVVQSWGMTDFRVVTPDNYYLRCTTSNVKVM